MQVVGPGGGRLVLDEGSVQQARERGLVLLACCLHGQRYRPGVQEADRAQCLAFGWGEVAQGAGDECGKVLLEVCGARIPALAPQFQVAAGCQVEVEGQSVRACCDGVPDRLVDQWLSVGTEAVDEVVLAVLCGEVAHEYLPGSDVGIAQSGPCALACPVQLSLQTGIRPLESVAAGDDEQGVGHQPYDALDQALEVAVCAVADVFERVQQDDQEGLLLPGHPGQVPRQKMGVKDSISVSGSASSTSARRAQSARARSELRRSRRAVTTAPVICPATPPTVPGRSSACAMSPSADCTCSGRAAELLKRTKADPVRRKCSSRVWPGWLCSQ